MAANKRVSFTASAPNIRSSRHPNYAEHTHVASLSRRRDAVTGPGVRFAAPKPRYYELKASQTHPGLRARGHYKPMPQNGGVISTRISHPKVDSKPRKDGRDAFNNYIEHLRRNRIQRQSYSLNRSFPSMRTMHDITSASPYMSTANRMRGAERTRFRLDLRSYPHHGAVPIRYADVAPMTNPPTYTAESFKALEAVRYTKPATTWTTKNQFTRAGPSSLRRAGYATVEDAVQALQMQKSSGLLGAVATVVKNMAQNAVSKKPRAVQERQVKEVIMSTTKELDSPKKAEVPLCTICLQNEANMKFYPCNHEATCEQCYEIHAKRRGRGKFCPICRSVIYTVEKAGVPYNLPKETTALIQAQSLLPYMGIRSIKLREPREPFVIKPPNEENRIYATLPQMNLGL